MRINKYGLTVEQVKQLSAMIDTECQKVIGQIEIDNKKECNKLREQMLIINPSDLIINPSDYELLHNEDYKPFPIAIGGLQIKAIDVAGLNLIRYRLTGKPCDGYVVKKRVTQIDKRNKWTKWEVRPA